MFLRLDGLSFTTTTIHSFLERNLSFYVIDAPQSQHVLRELEIGCSNSLLQSSYSTVLSDHVFAILFLSDSQIEATGEALAVFD